MRSWRVVLEGGRWNGEVEGRAVAWTGDVAKGCVAVAGWPAGQGKRMVRAIECSSAVKDGAWGVVVCPEVRLLLAAAGEGGVPALREELTELAKAGRAASPDVWLAVGVSRWAVSAWGGASAWSGLDWAAVERAARESGMDALVELADGG